MTDISVIMSGPMVRATLEDRKTMTRRLRWTGKLAADAHGFRESRWCRVKPGDRLWIRENFSGEHCWADIPPSGWGWDTMQRPTEFWYWADGNIPTHGDWTLPIPSIHMPRWASRLTLIVTGAKIERLWDISEADCEREGVTYETADPPFWYIPGIMPHSITAVGVEERADLMPHRVQCFRKLWNHLHGHLAWESNPEVVALNFRVIKANIDSELAKVA